MEGYSVKNADDMFQNIDYLNAINGNLDIIEKYIKGFHIYTKSNWAPLHYKLKSDDVLKNMIKNINTLSIPFSIENIDQIVDYDKRDKKHAYKINNRSRRYLIIRWFAQIKNEITDLEITGWSPKKGKHIILIINKLNDLIIKIIGNCNAKALLTLNNPNFTILMNDVISPLLDSNMMIKDKFWDLNVNISLQNGLPHPYESVHPIPIYNQTNTKLDSVFI